MIKSKTALIDISADNSNSLGVATDGMLLCGIQFPAAMTGSSVTFDFSMDNSTFVDVKENRRNRCNLHNICRRYGKS